MNRKEKTCIDCWFAKTCSEITFSLKKGEQQQLQDYWEKGKPSVEVRVKELKKLDSKAGQNLEQKIKELEKRIYKDKPIPKPNVNELCEKCGTSCVVGNSIKKKRYIRHKTDFTRESTCWFGTNCSCAREFREANQQTCPQCKKREFPHMKKGWMLDYEIHKAFCSPKCHVTYRELKWEEAQRLTRIELFPPELDVEANPNQNSDWEREGLRREVLYLRQLVRELEQRLRNNPPATPEERQQSNYLQRLQQNTLQRAEQSYQSQYGNFDEDNPNKDKSGLSKGVIILLVVGGIFVIGLIGYLLTRNKRKR